jgi:hypothetical protein
MSEAFGFRQFGGPGVQEFFDRPDPVPNPAEVLMRVTAASVGDQPADPLKDLRGAALGVPGRPPHRGARLPATRAWGTC